jgi:hypothetical protein
MATIRPLPLTYTVNTAVKSTIGDTKNITAMRLLILGYAILDGRQDEEYVENRMIFRSIIYIDDIAEHIGISEKSAKAILRKAEGLLKDINLKIEDKEYAAIESIITTKTCLTIVWNQEIVHFLSERVNIHKFIENLICPSM